MFLISLHVLYTIIILSSKASERRAHMVQDHRGKAEGSCMMYDGSVFAKCARFCYPRNLGGQQKICCHNPWHWYKFSGGKRKNIPFRPHIFHKWCIINYVKLPLVNPLRRLTPLRDGASLPETLFNSVLGTLEDSFGRFYLNYCQRIQPILVQQNIFENLQMKI